MTNDTTDIAIYNMQNISYCVSYHDIVKTWIEKYHSMDIVVIMYDPINHVEYIRSKGFEVPADEVYESKVLSIMLPSLDDAIKVVRNTPHETGPYTQVWALGRCITDNIDK